MPIESPKSYAELNQILMHLSPGAGIGLRLPVGVTAAELQDLAEAINSATAQELAIGSRWVGMAPTDASVANNRFNGLTTTE